MTKNNNSSNNSKSIDSNKKINMIIILLVISLFSFGLMQSPVLSIFDTNETLKVNITDSVDIDINIQDQTTLPISLRMNQVLQSNLTLAIDTIVNSKTITMSPGHNLISGDNIILLQENGVPSFFFCEILNVAGDILTLDSLVPNLFHANITTITSFDPNLNKDGSITPYFVELRNPFSIPIDINRLIFMITDTVAMDSSKFGGLPSLTNGISLRKEVSPNNNLHYWNVKNNGELKALTFDLTYDDKAPAGLYGVGSRMSYNGQDKHGVAIRLEQGQAIEIPILDDLTGLETFYITVEGHFTMGEENFNYSTS